MSQLEDDLSFDPEHFSGRVRLFPLPNLVLFPHVIQPLHVFESRYVDLLHDALEDDRLIAMSLLEPGWESDYEGRPPIARVACLGRVISWQALAGSGYNLLLLGLRRVRWLDELPPDRTFREAYVDILEDHFPTASAGRRPELQRELVAAFETLMPCVRDSEDLFNQLSLETMSFGTLTDVISFALDLNLPVKQALLDEVNVDRRAAMLLSHIRAASLDSDPVGLAAGFPPSFSMN